MPAQASASWPSAGGPGGGGSTFAALLRRHALDWAACVVLAAVDVSLLFVEPFHRYLYEMEMDDYRLPLRPQTVSTAWVPVIGLAVPALAILLSFAARRDARDLHQALLGLVASVAFTAVVTDVLKVSVGAPRPDFFARCFPDGQAVYGADGDVLCTGDAAIVREGYKSFPSGHSSWSFAGLGFLSLYAAGKLGAFDGSGHLYRAALALSPLLGATLVAVSRVNDYWHRWQDVAAGGALGLAVAWACYRQLYPPLKDEAAGVPYVALPDSSVYSQSPAEETDALVGGV